MNELDRVRRRRFAQQQAVEFFTATDGIIMVSKGIDAISQHASEGFVQAAYSMFLRDHNIDLRTQALEDATFLLFAYLESQTLNDHIEPELAFAYGQALALSLIKLGLHSEKAQAGYQFVIQGLKPVY